PVDRPALRRRPDVLRLGGEPPGVRGRDPEVRGGRPGIAPVAEHYGARFFGEREAAVYDEQLSGRFDPAVVTPTVDLLAGLAGGGRALEFAIGTGRIALPLAARGVRVDGIDASEAMVKRLRA